MNRKALFATAIAGLLVSGYLYITYVTGGPIVCNTDGGCEIVRASKYARLFGQPTPLYGLIFYLLLAVGALLATKELYKNIYLPLMALTGIGLAISVWLTYLEAFVIKAWCIWCLASALLTAIAFVLVWFDRSKHIATVKPNNNFDDNSN